MCAGPIWKKTDSEILATSAATDENADNRIVAVHRIFELIDGDGQDIPEPYAEAPTGIESPQFLPDWWFSIALADEKYRASAMAALPRISDPDLLTRLVLESPDRCVRNTALHRLKDESRIQQVLQNNNIEDIRQAVAYKLDGRNMYPSIAVIGAGNHSLPILNRLIWEGLPELRYLYCGIGNELKTGQFLCIMGRRKI